MATDETESCLPVHLGQYLFELAALVGLLIFALFLSQKCLGLDDKLYGHLLKAKYQYSTFCQTLYQTLYVNPQQNT